MHAQHYVGTKSIKVLCFYYCTHCYVLCMIYNNNILICKFSYAFYVLKRKKGKEQKIMCTCTEKKEKKPT